MKLARYLWDSQRWCVQSNQGTTLSLHDTKEEAQQAMNDRIKQKAKEVWDKMNDSQKHGVRFGMFPAEVMRQAEQEGFAGREFTCALMDCASQNGGMRA